LLKLRNVVNKGAAKADPMPAGVKEEEEVEGEKLSQKKKQLRKK